jgi:hypothetical protein
MFMARLLRRGLLGRGKRAKVMASGRRDCEMEISTSRSLATWRGAVDTNTGTPHRYRTGIPMEGLGLAMKSQLT